MNAVLVTGGGSGIGRAAAERLAADGWRVAVLDARSGAADEVVAGLRGALALTADVGDEKQVAAAVAEAAGSLGGLGAVVAAAGIARASDTHTTTLEEWELVLRVNLTGTFLTLKHALPHLLDGGGAIVTIGSVASLVAAGPSPSYDASKGGVLQLTRSVAAEYAGRGVRANCVLPGKVRTGLITNTEALSGASARQAAAPSTWVEPPLTRLADAAEIAGVIAFLLSDDASFLTGAAVPVDGGYTAMDAAGEATGAAAVPNPGHRQWTRDVASRPGPAKRPSSVDSMSDDLQPRVRRLELIELAKAATVEYGRACDRKDVPALRFDVFTDDVVLHLPGRDVHGADDVAAFYTGAFAAEPGTRRHFVTNQLTTVDDDGRVVVESYFLFLSADATSVIGWGAYRDVVVAAGDSVRIADKTIVLDVHTDVTRGWAMEPAT